MRSSTAVLIKGFTVIPSESDIEAGIYIYWNSLNCNISDNIIANFSEDVSYSRNLYGLYLVGRNCNVSRNVFVNNGLVTLTSAVNVVEDNMVNGKPLVCLKDTSDHTVGDAGQVVLINCNNIRVENLDLSRATVGLHLWGTTNSQIIGNNMAGNYFGCHLSGSSNNVISESNMTGNNYGCYLSASSSNVISGNNITDNKFFGIYSYVYSGDGDNEIFGNTITNNMYGMYCFHYMGDGNNIEKAHGNTVASNNYGVYIYEYEGRASINNKFYHNNFIDNTHSQVYSTGHPQVWDNGCEGNFWSDYTGTDTSTPPDGIGDTLLPWLGVDHHPLMNPYWNPTDINHDLKVDIKDVAVAAKAYGSFPGYPNWNPHADITGLVPLEPDNKVDIRDVALVAKNYGQIYV